MFTYESGLLAALLLWIAQLVLLLARLNSRMARNLAKVGYRLSWLNGAIKEMSPSDFNRSIFGIAAKFSIIVALGLASVLLSWLSVLASVGIMAYSVLADRGAPQAVREFRWKLRNVDLSRDDLIHELMSLPGASGKSFEEVREETLSRMRFDP